MGSGLRVATATVFFVRLPLPFRAAGREVITLERIQLPPEFCSVTTLRIPRIDCQCRQSDSFTSAGERRITSATFPGITEIYGRQGWYRAHVSAGCPARGTGGSTRVYCFRRSEQGLVFQGGRRGARRCAGRG